MVFELDLELYLEWRVRWIEDSIKIEIAWKRVSLVTLMVKNPPAMWETWV